MSRILFVLPKESGATWLHSEPLGIMYLSAVVKPQGHTTEAVLANWRDLSAKVKSFAPDVLAFTASTGAHGACEQLAYRIKHDHPRLITIVGGPHPTYYPQMIEKPGIDVICRGEGELAFEEFIGRLESGADFSDVQNLWVKRDDGKIIRNPPRPEIADLDSIPFPDRSLCANHYHRNVRWAITSRGCPFNCSYCSNHAYRTLYAEHRGKPVRHRSIPNVIAELKEILKNHSSVKQISFVDDIFNINHRWLLEFLEVYRAEIGIPFGCLARIDHMSASLAKAMARAGCSGISIGIEAGNEKLRQRVLHRDMSNETIIRGCRQIREAGIRLRTLSMLGIPPGDFRTEWETVELNVQCRPHLASATLLTPFPMTAIAQQLEANGSWDPADIDNYSLHQYRERSALKLNDKVAIEVLHQFFPYAVRIPFLRGFIRWLCTQAEILPWLAQLLYGVRKPHRIFQLRLHGLYARLLKPGGF